MEKWILYAVISMFFAGFTSVIAKLGLSGISSELGLTIRTIFVSFFIIVFAIIFVSFQELTTVSKLNLWWLGLSGVTTAFSWIFYYKALKIGDVATIALIDKGSVVVVMLLAWFLLKEVITLRRMNGAILISCCIIVIAKR